MKSFISVVENILLTNSVREACNLWYTATGYFVYYDTDNESITVSQDGDVVLEIKPPKKAVDLNVQARTVT